MSRLLKTILLVFEELLQCVFPPSEDEKLLVSVSLEVFLKKLDVNEVGGVTTLAKFNDPLIRAAVHLVKFHRHPKALRYTGALLGQWLAARTGPTIVIPIPLSKKRYRERGFNQTELIVRHAIKGLPSFAVETGVLARARNTAPQTSLSRAERLKNLEGAFTVTAAGAKLAGKHVILFDDVLTTGATLEAAKAALLPLKPASITCVVLAH